MFLQEEGVKIFTHQSSSRTFLKAGGRLEEEAGEGS